MSVARLMAWRLGGVAVGALGLGLLGLGLWYGQRIMLMALGVGGIWLGLQMIRRSR